MITFFCSFLKRMNLLMFLLFFFFGERGCFGLTIFFIQIFFNKFWNQTTKPHLHSTRKCNSPSAWCWNEILIKNYIHITNAFPGNLIRDEDTEKVYWLFWKYSCWYIYVKNITERQHMLYLDCVLFQMEDSLEPYQTSCGGVSFEAMITVWHQKAGDLQKLFQNRPHCLNKWTEHLHQYPHPKHTCRWLQSIISLS